MPLHQYGYIPVDIWNGPDPKLINQQLTVSVRPGVDGTATALAGKWAESFEVEMTSVYQFYEDALFQRWLEQQMIGGVWAVMKDLVDYQMTFATLYRAMNAQTVRLATIVHFIGPDKDLIYPTEIVTRWTLLPVASE